ncbi:MAG: Gfo/Idh/MocA family oxidoreductase [Kiritimatiellia bacterium]|nr:Gfo/Idh/MocA family oxidoreductase [Kiritimatiellia bacterium]
MLKFGLVGVGTHARWAVMEAIEKTSKHCELVAACDLRGENLEPLSRQGLAIFTDFDEMIRKVEMDALYVCTPCDAHFGPAVAGLRAGLHVICEKPLADTVAQCRNMIAEAEKADRKLVVTFENRYHPDIRKIKEWITAGYLGKVEAVHTHYYTGAYKPFGEEAARRKRLLDLAGSLDCGIHAFDYIRYFVGGEWQDIRAMGAWFDDDLLNAPHITVQGRLTSGVIVTVTYSYAYTAYIKATATASCGITIVGKKGVISHCTDYEKPADMKLTSEDLVESFPIESVPHKLAIGWLVDDFADFIEGRKKTWPAELATGHDGLVAQLVVDEALTQTRTQKADRG